MACKNGRVWATLPGYPANETIGVITGGSSVSEGTGRQFARVGYLADFNERFADREGWYSLVLRATSPLSYLRVADGQSVRPGRTLARILIESRCAELRRRIPVVLDDAELDELGNSIAYDGGNPLLPIIEMKDAAGAERQVAFIESRDVAFLDGEAAGAEAVDRVRLQRPGIEIEAWTPAGLAALGRPGFRQQYGYGIYSGGSFCGPDSFLVWPNGTRPKRARGNYVVALPQSVHAEMGRPPYILVENPVTPGRYAAGLAVPDEALGAQSERHPFVDGRSYKGLVAIDRGLREVLGICDGEAARIYPWRDGRLSRRLHTPWLSPRTVFAHPSVPIRSDLEKPVCRLSRDAMESIGVSDGDNVSIEVLTRHDDEFVRRSITKRVLAIDPDEALRRAEWENGDSDSGYLDCAAFHGVFPKYPTIYLDFFDLKQLFARDPDSPGAADAPSCPVVQVSPVLRSKLTDELGELAWIGVIGVIAVVAQVAEVSAGWLAVIVAALVVVLLWFRLRRDVR